MDIVKPMRWAREMFAKGIVGFVSPPELVLDLYKSNTLIVDSMKHADFTIADFDGYNTAPFPMDFLNTFYDFASGDYVSGLLNPQQFAATGNTNPNTVYGWILFDLNGPDFPIWFAYRFPTPIPMVKDGDLLIANPEWHVPPFRR